MRLAATGHRLVVLLFLFVSLPSAGQSVLGPGGTFLDDDFRSAEPAIEALVAGGITNGCGAGLFCPLLAVTRGQMATFLGRALKAGSSEAGAFTDLIPGSYYEGSVNRLFELGVVSGYPDGTFRPEAQVRERRWRRSWCGRAGLETLLDGEPTAATFIDVPADAWFAPFVEALRLAGITTGCAVDRFCPEAAVTREQMALFLARAFQLPLPVVPVRTSRQWLAGVGPGDRQAGDRGEDR